MVLNVAKQGHPLPLHVRVRTELSYEARTLIVCFPLHGVFLQRTSWPANHVSIFLLLHRQCEKSFPNETPQLPTIQHTSILENAMVRHVSVVERITPSSSVPWKHVARVTPISLYGHQDPSKNPRIVILANSAAISSGFSRKFSNSFRLQYGDERNVPQDEPPTT